MKTGKITMGLTALALAGMLAIPVSAQEITETKDTAIKASVQSAYTLTIPAATDIEYEKTLTDLSGMLKVTGNVLPTQEIQVTAKANPLRNKAQGTELPYKLLNKTDNQEFGNAVWNETELRDGLAGGGKEIQLGIAIQEADWKTAEAGDYEGSITFTAVLREK